MATSQAFCSWIVLLLSSASITESCHPLSKELHICLNIYLERDFPIIETILKGQRTPSYGGGRVLLEGPDLQNICRQIGLLQKCYDDVLVECDTYWQLERYQRLMAAFNESYIHLCGINNDKTTNMRDILVSSTCVSQASHYLSECDVHEIRWFVVWKKILRLEVSAQEICSNIVGYEKCLTKKLNNFSCGKKASGPYGTLLKVWVESWCTVDSTVRGTSSCGITPHFSLIVFSVLLILSFR